MQNVKIGEPEIYGGNARSERTKHSGESRPRQKFFKNETNPMFLASKKQNERDLKRRLVRFSETLKIKTECRPTRDTKSDMEKKPDEVQSAESEVNQ